MKAPFVKGALMMLVTAGWGSVAYDALPVLWQTDGFTAACVALSIASTIIRGWVLAYKEGDA